MRVRPARSRTCCLSSTHTAAASATRRRARHRHHRAPVAEGRAARSSGSRTAWSTSAAPARPGRRQWTASWRYRADGTVLGDEAARDLADEGRGLVAPTSKLLLANFTGCYAIPTALRPARSRPTSARQPQPRHGPAAPQLRARAADGPRRPRARPRPRGDPPAELHPEDAFPYTIASGNEYDSGDYAAALATRAGEADYPSLRAEQAAARAARAATSASASQHDRARRVRLERLRDRRAQPGTGAAEGATVAIDSSGSSPSVGFALERAGPLHGHGADAGRLVRRRRRPTCGSLALRLGARALAHLSGNVSKSSP